MKQKPFRNWQRLPGVLAASLITAAAASPEPGYLARLGPSPLRFLPVFRLSTNKFVLPVPVRVPEPTNVPTQMAKAPMPVAPHPAPPATAITVTNLPAITNLAPPPPSPDAAPVDGVISPQMLLKYFNKSTNGSSSSVIAPLEFTPSKAAGPPGSSVTYSTGP